MGYEGDKTAAKIKRKIDEDRLHKRAGGVDKKYEVVWEPQPGSQTLYMSCPIYEALYDGTRGSQKTDSLIMDFAQHIGQGHGRAWRGLIFRRTYKQLDDIIDRTKKWFHQIFPGAKYNEAKYVWTWPDGEQLLLRHMDNPSDYWNYHGHEIPFIGWEELTGWPDDKCYETMKSCCRSSDAGVPRKYRATTNPWGIGMSWVKRYFVDPAPAGTIIENEIGEKRVRIHGSILENKILLKADPDYIMKLDSIKDENKRKAWRDGDWNITAGGALDDVWDEVRHVIDPFEVPRSWYCDRSFDWGSARPFSVGWWAESDGTDVQSFEGKTLCFPRGTLFRIHEYYGWNGTENEGCRMLAKEVAKEIKRIENTAEFVKIIGNNYVNKGPADSSIFSEENNMCIATDMAREGITWTKADKRPGSRRHGLEKLRRYLKNAMVFPMEDPGIIVFSTCRQFIRTVPTLPRDGANIEDVSSIAEDHCFDGDTPVTTDAGIYKIKDLVGKTGLIQTVGGYYAHFDDCRMTRKAEMNQITFDDGTNVKCTTDQKFLTENGWVFAQNLTNKNVVGFAGNGRILVNEYDEDSDELIARIMQNEIMFKRKTIGVKKLPIAKTYCMNVENSHCFALENGVIVSNCYDETRYRLTHKRYGKRSQTKYK